MKNLNSNPELHNRKLEVFVERCEARALLWCSGLLELHDAVDELYWWAERNLIPPLDTDDVQRIMARAFEPRRIR